MTSNIEEITDYFKELFRFIRSQSICGKTELIKYFYCLGFWDSLSIRL